LRIFVVHPFPHETIRFRLGMIRPKMIVFCRGDPTMAFKDNLRKKIEINDWAARIKASMGPPDSGRRIDKDLMRRLLAEGGYEKTVEREMEIYRLPPLGDQPRLLVLDNDLPIYKTSLEDVVLRKNPIVKEMLNLRNVIKILNDAKVVISKKDASLETVREELIGGLDLRFTKEDIDDLVYDGRSAMENRYSEGVQETLRLMAELLGYVPAPKPLQVPHTKIWGNLGGRSGQRQFGPLVIYDPMHNTLKHIQSPIDLSDPDDVKRFEAVVSKSAAPDHEGGQVFKALGQSILETHGGSGDAHGDSALSH
jgi:hypothetical protein